MWSYSKWEVGMDQLSRPTSELLQAAYDCLLPPEQIPKQEI